MTTEAPETIFVQPATSISPMIAYLGVGSWPGVRTEYTRTDAIQNDTRVKALVEALGAMVHTVCGETGFAACVRADSRLAYPWPALDEAETAARAALAAMEPRK